MANGRSNITFRIGQKIEFTQEAYEKESVELAAMKNAFAMAVKCLEEYREAMVREQQEAKLTIKEVEYGKTYVNRCIELISNLCIGAQQKCLRAEGAVDALKKAVASIKEVYDEELAVEQLKPVRSKKP